MYMLIYLQMVNMSGWWAVKLRVLCWETKKVGKKVKNKTKQNKTKNKQMFLKWVETFFGYFQLNTF